MKDSYVSPLNSRYASREMQYLFSPDKKFTVWRKLWIALAESEKELGIDIPDKAIEEMREAIKRTTDLSMSGSTITSHATVESVPVAKPVEPAASTVTVTPGPLAPPTQPSVEKPEQKPAPTKVNSSIIELANNPDFSVATIAKEANRIRKEDGEVFISLH